ncbi:MAG: hypothetical protein P8Z81_11245 [Deinococcales bacterium]
MRRHPRSALLALVAAWLLAAWPVAALAQNQLAVEISPPNSRLSANPGDQLQASFNVTNSGNLPVSLSVVRSDGVLGPTGSLIPVASGSLPQSLTSWLTTSTSQLELAPQQTTELRYSIDVPKDATPGTHWGLILVRNGSPGGSADNGHAVGVDYVTQLAYVVYVDVGQGQATGKVTDIKVAQAPANSKHRGEIAQVGFQNTGDSLMVMRGRLELRSLDGTLVKTYTIGSMPVLPGGFSILEVNLDPSLQAGTYLATAVLNDGSPRLIAGQAQIEVRPTP